MEPLPHTISWNITRRCNLHCAHCYLDAAFREGRRGDELDTGECLRVIDQITAVNPNALLILTGGEPLLRPDLFTIADYATRQGLLPVIGTNGTLLTRGLAQKMLRHGVKGVGLSLHALRPEAHDAFTGVPGSWARAVRGAAMLRDTRRDFIIQTCCASWNYDEIPALADFAHELGARVFNLYFLVCSGRGQGMTDISAARREAILGRLFEIQKAYEGRLLVGAKCAPQYQRIIYQADPASPFLRTFSGGCPAAIHYCQITPRGDVTPCPYLSVPAGNVRETPFAEIWQAAPLLVELRDRGRLRGRCGRCEFRTICSGCRARAYAETRDWFAEDPSCPYEPGRHGQVPIGLDVTRTFGLEAEGEMVWTESARERLARVPSFARGMVLKGVERFARERGLAEVTPEVMQEARASFLGAMKFPPARWTVRP
ncbi:MAG: radical SAM protein [Deltaproteobacteria bacterium]|nr:radical SAM protein [Deltaproteobacteria bacterium]